MSHVFVIDMHNYCENSELLIKENLASNIYNNASETVLTLNEYQDIANHLSGKKRIYTGVVKGDLKEGLRKWKIEAENAPMDPNGAHLGICHYKGLFYMDPTHVF